MVAILWRPTQSGEWERVQLDRVTDDGLADGYYPEVHLGLKESEVTVTMVPVRVVPVIPPYTPQFDEDSLRLVNEAWEKFKPVAKEQGRTPQR